MSEGAPKPTPEAPKLIIPDGEIYGKKVERQRENLKKLVAELIAKNGTSNKPEDWPAGWFGKKKLEVLKARAEKAQEEFVREIEKTEKASKRSKSDVAMAKYRKQEEKLDTRKAGGSPEEKGREELKRLKAEADRLKEEYELDIETTGKGVKYSKWRDALDKYREMEESLDHHVSKKAKEPKAPASGEPMGPEADTKPGTTPDGLPLNPEVFPVPTPIVPEGPPAPDKKDKEGDKTAPATDPFLGPPAPPVTPPAKGPELKKPEKISLVNANELADLQAEKRGDERLTEKLNHSGLLKKKWVHMWETNYRQQFKNEERKKILGQENRPGFIRRGLLGAEAFDASGKKNLFAGTGKEDRSDSELGGLATRFAEDLNRESSGEVKKQMEDPEFSTKINDLIHGYATGAIDEAKFNTEKEALIDAISAKYPDSFAKGSLTADNMLEAARDFRKIHEHTTGLARTEVNLQIDLGVAKKAIKTEANLNFIDKAVSASQKYLGPGVSPEAVGIAVSLGSYFARKPLYWLGGAAGLGGVMGAMRRNVEQKNDLAMHRRERALGDRKASGKGREAAEKFVYEMRTAAEITDEVAGLSAVFKRDPSPANAEALTTALAEAEARQSLSETRQRDLISFSGEMTLERGRLDMMRTLAEGRVALKNAGHELDIRASDAYKHAETRIGGEMDKIDRSEKGHRWTENGKAAVVGALGGLVVGGVVQEALAIAGDHIKPLHWLRPGGKTTSIETFYHFIKGDGAPLAPTGAGMQQFLGFPNSSGTIKIDGTTELIKDPTTGLMTLVDKSDHSKILASVDIDPLSGKVTPVPGSYDPKLINFTETKAGGGAAQTMQQWISSIKGQFGSNVAEDTWHTKGFLDNNTPKPKFEFNELKLVVEYDKNGNLKIDASRLQEFAKNAAGAQTQGSAHGAKVLDVASEFAKGTIKIGLAPEFANQTSVLELKYDAGTKSFVAPPGSRIQDFFEKDAKTGQPKLKGDGLLGIIHDLGANAKQEGRNVEWVNAIRGNGSPIDTGKGERIITEIGRNTPVGWWGPWIWSFGRKPLEERKPNEGFVDLKGKYFDFKPEDVEGMGENEGKKIKDVKIDSATVDTRGQKIAIDAKDWEKEYPEKFPLKDEKQMAEFLMNQGNFFMSLKDREQYMKRGTQAERTEFLIKRIQGDREFLAIEGDEGLDAKRIDEIVNIVLKETDKIFNKYGEKGRSLLPARERIHVVGALEYQAQMREAGTGSLGVCFNHSGEMFINFDLIKASLFKGGPVDTDILVSQLKRTIAHEVTHGAVANNYWMLATEGNPEKIPVLRRTGVQMLRRQAKGGGAMKKGGEQIIFERGRALNEAITEELSKEITESIYQSEGARVPKSIVEPYSAEREVLDLLGKKYEIPFATFAKAAIDRKALATLAIKLDGRTVGEGVKKGERIKRPQFMALLFGIMDAEALSRSGSYRVTKQLIEGKKGIMITKEMKKHFAPTLLERDGRIKAKLMERYLLVDEEEFGKMPKAA